MIRTGDGYTHTCRARYSRGQLGHEVRTRITKQNILIGVVNDSSDSDLIFLVKYESSGAFEVYVMRA